MARSTFEGRSSVRGEASPGALGQLPSFSSNTKINNFLARGAQGLFGSSPIFISIGKLALGHSGAFWQLPGVNLSTKIDHFLARGAQVLFAVPMS